MQSDPEANVQQMLNADPEELERFKELHDHALAEIEAANSDPTQQQYFKRLDKNTIVQSEREFQWCVANMIPIKLVSYDAAVTCIDQSAAKLRAKRARRKASKRARASRKANRKHG